MKKMSSFLGIIAGISVIVLSVMVFDFKVDIKKPRVEEISYVEIEEPATEDNKYYGGDAYTGMQQAAAQAANNIIPVYKTVKQGNEALTVLNENNKNIATTNSENLNTVIEAIRYFFGILLLAMGILTVAKYIGAFLESFEKNSKESSVTTTSPTNF